MQLDERRVVWTVGHGTASAAAFLSMLGSVGIETIVDVRRFPAAAGIPTSGVTSSRHGSLLLALPTYGLRRWVAAAV